jgi:hypothetical protein
MVCSSGAPSWRGQYVLLVCSPHRILLSVLSILGVILSPLSQLRDEISALTEDKAEVPFIARHTWTLPASASAIVFAHHDTRLLVALFNGSICIYDHTDVFSGVSGPSSPLHTFQSHTGVITSILPNPEGAPELVAVSRIPSGDSAQQVVEILDINNMSISSAWTSGSSFDSTPVTCMSYFPVHLFEKLMRYSVLVSEGKTDRAGYEERWHYCIHSGRYIHTETRHSAPSLST